MPAGERDGAPSTPSRGDEKDEQQPDRRRRVVDEDVPILRVRDAARAAFLTLDDERRLARETALERAEVVKLLETGKTDLLEKFISKTGRPYSAWLKLEKGGKVAFEFPDRD